MDSTSSQEDLLQGLMAQARSKWGDQRAADLRASLESTARQLLELERNFPNTKTEPGVYPTLH